MIGYKEGSGTATADFLFDSGLNNERYYNAARLSLGGSLNLSKKYGIPLLS